MGEVFTQTTIVDGYIAAADGQVGGLWDSGTRLTTCL